MGGAVVPLYKGSSFTDAEFRGWGSGVSGQLTALGCPKTGDTGQIDWTTVNAQSGGSSWVAGYEVRAFSDSLQATRPIVFKIEYGNSTTTGANNGVWLTVGTASNGSGTIAAHASWPGTVSAREALPTGSMSVSSTATSNCFFGNADGSAIGALLWPSTGDSTYGGIMFAIERFRNADGTPNGDGFSYWFTRSTNSNTTMTFGQLLYSASLTQASAQSQALVPFPYGWGSAPGSQLIGTALYPLPVFTGLSPKLQGPSQLLVAMGRGDMVGGTQFEMAHYGTARTWAAAGQGTSGGMGWGVWASAGATTTSINTSVYPTSFAMRIS